MRLSLLIKTTSLFFVLFIITIVVSEFSSPAYSDTNGAPATRTGSPGDGANCTSCHAGTASSVAGLITSDVPVTGYIPGSTYTITGTVSETGKTKFGFEISPQNISGILLGSLVITNATATKLIGAGKYVTHKSTGTSFPSGTATWSFNWVAPVAGTGDVTFYGAFNVTNSSGSTAGDVCRLSTLLVSENLFAGINTESNEKQSWTLFPNPVKDILYLKNDIHSDVNTIEILDITGKLVKSYTKDDLVSENIDVSFLESGMYVIHITSDVGSSTKKFIKN